MTTEIPPPKRVIYIAHEDGTFQAHVTRNPEDFDPVTDCGITWASLPDIVYNDGSTELGDKPWYYDHDREDVEPCSRGCSDG